MPLTVTSSWFGQVRQNSSSAPRRIAPGSATTSNLGTSLVDIHAAVVGHDRHDIGGFAVDRDLAGPRQGRSASFSRIGERAAVLVHLGVAQRAQDRTGQDPLDEHVLSSTIASPADDRIAWNT